MAHLSSELRTIRDSNGNEHRLISSHSITQELFFAPILPQDLETIDPQIWQSLSTDLETLLHFPHSLFWSHVLHGNQSLNKFLDMFLRFFPRPWESEFGVINHPLVKEVSRRVLVVFLRMGSRKEGKDNFFSTQAFSEIVYNNWLFDMPKLLDLCCIYGRRNRKVLRSTIIGLFEAQPLYISDCMESWNTSTTILEKLNEKLSANEELQDEVPYIKDILSSWLSFWRVLPESVLMLNDVIFNTVALLSHVTELCRDGNITLLSTSIVDIIIARCLTDPIMTAEPIQCMERDMKKLVKHMGVLSGVKACEVLESILVLLVGANDEHPNTGLIAATINLSSRVEHVLAAMPRHMDEAVVNYIAHVIAGHTDTTPIPPISSSTPITKIKEVFPDYSDQFCGTILTHYDNDAEKAIHALLEGTVPVEVMDQQYGVRVADDGVNVEVIMGKRRVDEDEGVDTAKHFAAQWNEESDDDWSGECEYEDEYVDSHDAFGHDKLDMVEGGEAESVVVDGEAVSQPVQWSKARGQRGRRARTNQRWAARAKKTGGW